MSDSFNIERCHLCEQDGEYNGSMNMGYGRSIPSYHCKECEVKWFSNDIEGYLGIPTGRLVHAGGEWVPSGVVGIWDEEV